MYKLAITTIFLNCLFHNALPATDKVICYYRRNDPSFLPSDIDTDICTHINYAFVGIEPDGSLRIDDGDEIIRELSNLKKKNPKIKLLFSVGGWSEGTATFSAVAASSDKLAKMASSCVDFLRKYNFDGIDIDWEYPAQREGQPSDKENFITMLKTLQNKLRNKGNYLLSVAVESNPNSRSYDVSGISDAVDFINLMTYDLGSRNKTSGNAPLYASSRDSQWQKEHANCDAAVKNWKKAGAATDKLILGLAFYGYSYQLKDSNDHGVGAPVISKDNGLPYNKICTKKSGWTEAWDDEQKFPYKYKDVTWINFDNPASIKLRVEYAKKQKLGGVMMWSVNQDDKNGACGPKFGLLKEIKKNL